MSQNGTELGSIPTGGRLGDLHFRVDEDLQRRIYNAFDYGEFARVMRALCEMTVRAVEKDGKIILAAIVSGEYEIVYSKIGRRKADPTIVAIVERGEHGERQNLRVDDRAAGDDSPGASRLHQQEQDRTDEAVVHGRRKNDH